ncbi:MAG: penicillin-binding protein activator [Actinobacteria bacterium]|nr:penicillin-binding protein activator [Actinomycetota bacterium]
MKKPIFFVSMILVLLLVIGVLLAACGGNETTTTAAPTETTAASTQSTAAPTETSAASTETTAAATTGVIKIGHIRPLSGVMATTSDRMIKAFDFAFEQVGYQATGKKIEIIVGDSKGDPATAVEVARKMVESDGVSMLVGPTQGGEEMAVAAYASQVGIPVLFTNPAPMGAATPDMAFAVSGYGTEPQISSAMGVYCYDQAGYRNVDLLSGDFAPGHGFLGAFKAAFTKKGGTIVQEIYTPYPSEDFSPYLTTLKDADAVVAWIDGEQAIKLLTQYHQLSIDKRMPIVGAFHGSFLAPFILSALPADVSDSLVGALVPVPYSPLLDTAVNTKFVADFKAKFNVLPEDMDSGPYVGAQIIMHALEATNGDTTPAKLRDALVAVNFEGPEGPIKFDPQTRAAIKTVYIAKVAKQDGAFVWQPVFTYPDVPPAGL